MNPFFKGAQPMQAQAGGLDMHAVNTVRSMIGNLRSVQNPNAVLQTLSGKNPLLGNVMRMVQGKDPRQVFYAECQRCGVDPNEIINLLK